MSREWTIKEIRDLVEKRFNKRPCWYQIKVALALRAGKDVITWTATGAGKTLSFWIALLMAMEEGEDKMIIVVTPLNLLGKQNVESLCHAGLHAIAVSSENANPTVYEVSTFYFLENRKLTMWQFAEYWRWEIRYWQSHMCQEFAHGLRCVTWLQKDPDICLQSIALNVHALEQYTDANNLFLQ